MRTSQQIVAEIEERFGFLPAFFSPAQQNPQVLENLWQQTLLAYIDNPLPALFKEKLFTYLSRYCASPYCVICHSCNLSQLGMRGSEVLNLLVSPPPTEADIDEYLKILAQTECLTWQSNSSFVDSLLGCSIFIALEQDSAKQFCEQLRQILGSVNYQHLVALIAYIKTRHQWMGAYPEVSYEADKQVVEHLNTLLEDEPGLVDFFRNHQEKVRHERQNYELQRVELINERKRVEAALQEQESRYQPLVNAQAALQQNQTKLQRLVENMPGMAYRYLPCKNGPHQFTFVNAAAHELLELEPEMIVRDASSFVKLIHPDDLPSFQESVAASVQDFLPWHWQGRIITPSGQHKWVQGSSRPERTAEGEVWDGLLVDITERKRTEEALHQLTLNLESLVAERTVQLQQALELEAMLKRITDKVRDSLNESQILQTVVQELVLVLGVSCCNTALYNLEMGTSTICYEYATANPGAQARVAQIASFPELYQQLLQGQYCQFCSIVPNPLRGRVAMLACPIFDEQGVLGDLWLINQQSYGFNELEIRLVQQVSNQCAIAIRTARLYRAVTKQVEELEKLNRFKDDFLSTVSHELRTPVSNMKIAIHMLRITNDAAAKERYLKILQTECDREAELIEDLLDLQRLEEGSYNLTIKGVNLQDWVSGIVESFRSRTASNQQTLQVNILSDLPPLHCDRVGLERILAELLNNACKYTPPGGEVVLSIDYKSVEAATIFSVSNSAEIPEVELPRIFNKFYRVPNADPWKKGGTGLGLALVQRLVEQLRGTIRVESSRGWTTFTVQFSNQPDDT